MAVLIHTIGHGTRPIEEFLAILGAAGIRRLVDVRTAPGSRRHPQFGRDALAASLQGRAIEYMWRKELGGFRRPRVDSPHVALRHDAFRGYADHMETEGFRSALAWLLALAVEAVSAFGLFAVTPRRLPADTGAPWRLSSNTISRDAARHWRLARAG